MPIFCAGAVVRSPSPGAAEGVWSSLRAGLSPFSASRVLARSRSRTRKHRAFRPHPRKASLSSQTQTQTQTLPFLALSPHRTSNLQATTLSLHQTTFTSPARRSRRKIHTQKPTSSNACASRVDHLGQFITLLCAGPLRLLPFCPASTTKRVHPPRTH